MLCVPLSVTVNCPVASDPAEKVAPCPCVHGCVGDSPLASVLQFDRRVSQVPEGVGPPAPDVAPLVSQYSAASLAAPVARQKPSAREQALPILARRIRRICLCV